MEWLIPAGLWIVAALLILLGRRGNSRRLSRVDPTRGIEVSLIDEWTTKHSSYDRGVYWDFWGSVKRPGSDRNEKVKVAEATYASQHPPAIATLQVHPRTGRIHDNALGRRVRFGLETAGWLLMLAGVAILIASFGGINEILNR